MKLASLLQEVNVRRALYFVWAGAGGYGWSADHPPRRKQTGYLGSSVNDTATHYPKGWACYSQASSS